MKNLSKFVTPMTPFAFAMTYQDHRQGVYLRAAEKNRIRGFNDRLAVIRAFTKCQGENFTAKEPIPRVIQPRDPRYLSESGRYVKPVEKIIYKNINKLFGYTIAYKGLNAKQRGMELHKSWRQFKRPVAVGLDAKRFDQRVSIAALLLDHDIIKNFYPGDKHIKRVLDLQLTNICKGKCEDGYLSYKTDGCRMSGDSNTSCGNVVICCAILYGFKEKFRFNMRMLNDGDDCVVIMEEENLDEFMENIGSHFELAGFSMEIEKPVRVLEEVVFCSTQPIVSNDGTYVMVRDPRTNIAKDCIAIKPLDNEKIKRMWLCAVGSGGLSLTMGMPVWQEFYSMLKKESKGAKKLVDHTLKTGFARMSKGMQLRNPEITAETRLSFWKAFQITPSEQETLEVYYSNYKIGVGHHKNRYVALPLYWHVR